MKRMAPADVGYFFALIFGCIPPKRIGGGRAMRGCRSPPSKRWRHPAFGGSPSIPYTEGSAGCHPAECPPLFEPLHLCGFAPLQESCTDLRARNNYYPFSKVNCI